MCVTAVSLACITVSPPCLPPAGSVQLRPSAAHTGHAQLRLRAPLPETQPADARPGPAPQLQSKASVLLRWDSLLVLLLEVPEGTLLHPCPGNTPPCRPCRGPKEQPGLG